MKYLIFLPLLLLLASPAHAWRGTILEIVDGDTITVAPKGQKDSPIRVRLYGIDAPEHDQPHGAESTARLRTLLPLGKSADIIPMATDKYGRTVGLIIYRGTTVNLKMVEQGDAWFYPQFCRAYFCRQWKDTAQKARRENKGLWEAETAGQVPIPPWTWRRNTEKTQYTQE